MMRDRRGTKKSNTVVQDIVANPRQLPMQFFIVTTDISASLPSHNIQRAFSLWHPVHCARQPPELQTARTKYCLRRVPRFLHLTGTGKLHPIAAQTQPFQPLRLQIHSCTDIHPRHLVQHRRTRAANGSEGSRWFGRATVGRGLPKAHSAEGRCGDGWRASPFNRGPTLAIAAHGINRSWPMEEVEV